MGVLNADFENAEGAKPTFLPFEVFESESGSLEGSRIAEFRFSVRSFSKSGCVFPVTRIYYIEGSYFSQREEFLIDFRL